MSHRLRRMFGQGPFALLVAVVGFLAFNWPFLEPARAAGAYALFLYFFGIWAGIILLAFLISRAVAAPDEKPGGDDA